MENTKKANIEVTIYEKILYNYINSGLFLNINKSHIPYNKKDKLMKPKEKNIRKKGGRNIEEREIKYFYAHSYCSGESGSNENNNKLIRRFLLKGRDFKKVTEKEIKQLEKYINEYRRKLFGEKKSREIFEMEYSKYEN